MRSNQSGRSAYKQTIRDTEAPKDLERRVIGQVTHALEQLPDEATFALTEDNRAALADNQKLWGVLLFDVMETENPLPEKLKAGIISLAMFVDQYTPEVMAGRKAAQPLITINRNIMRGMKGLAPAAESPGG